MVRHISPSPAPDQKESNGDHRSTKDGQRTGNPGDGTYPLHAYKHVGSTLIP